MYCPRHTHTHIALKQDITSDSHSPSQSLHIKRLTRGALQRFGVRGAMGRSESRDCGCLSLLNNNLLNYYHTPLPHIHSLPGQGQLVQHPRSINAANCRSQKRGCTCKYYLVTYFLLYYICTYFFFNFVHVLLICILKWKNSIIRSFRYCK